MMLVALLSAGFIASCTAAPPPASTPIAPPRAAQDATTQTVAQQRPVLIEFYSTICAICKQIQPTVNRLEGEYDARVDFLAYDVAGINNDIKRQYKYIGFPQIVILDANGEIMFSRLGYQSYDSLKADIEAVLMR